MKNLSKNEMNAVVGGIGPKSTVSGGLGGLDVSKCCNINKVGNVAGKMCSVAIDPDIEDYNTPL